MKGAFCEVSAMTSTSPSGLWSSGCPKGLAVRAGVGPEPQEGQAWACWAHRSPLQLRYPHGEDMCPSVFALLPSLSWWYLPIIEIALSFLSSSDSLLKFNSSPPELALIIGASCSCLFKNCSAPLFLLEAHSHTTHVALEPFLPERF